MTSFWTKLSEKSYYRWMLAISSGLLLSISWYDPFTPLIFMALAPLIALEHSLADEKRKYAKFFGFSFLSLAIWNVGVIWWLWNASGWATLGAWLANAFLQTSPLIIYQFLRRSGGERFGALTFFGSWISFEYLHLNWDLSWPWLNLGNVFAEWPSWIQWYEHTGVLGGSLWVLVANWIAYNVIFKRRLIVGWAIIILFPMVYSFWVWSQYEPKGEEVEVVVVQPNLDCYTEKFQYNAKTGERGQASYIPYQEQVNRMIRLSEEKVTEKTRWVLWPETALHQGVEESNPLAYLDTKKAAQWTRNHPNLSLVTGIDSHIIYKDPKKHTPTTRYYEGYGYYDKYGAALFISPDSIDFYHKSKLVIGVETIPFGPVLKPLIMNFGGTSGGLGTQIEREVFKYAGSGGLAPVICYESVYGEFVGDYIKKGASFIGIITNDGWWGNTSGHRQHLHYARLRAIETRRSVARSANTGVSGFINQKGEVLQTSKYDEEIALKGAVRLNTEMTNYTLWGDYIGRLLGFLTAFMIISVAVKNKVEYKPKKNRKGGN